MFDEEFDEKPSLEELQHYGVLGMKWGVHKNPQRAYTKSIKKLEKLDTKSEKSAAKSEKYLKKAEAKRDRAAYLAYKRKYRLSFIGKRKIFRASDKAARYSHKALKAEKRSLRLSKKAQKWADSMNRYLSNTKLSDVSNEEIALGKKYSLMMMDEHEKNE